MQLTCPDCSAKFESSIGDGTEVITCPQCRGDVSLTETIREESVPEITLPELCPFTPQSDEEGDEYSYYGSVLEYLSSLRDRDGSGPFTGVIEGASNVGDAGSHKLGEMIAQGGMGAVFNARDLNIRRNVAMKVMLDPEEADEKALLRFVEEAQITGQLEHPGIVPVHQLGIDGDGNLFYTMKYVRGLTLGEIIRGLKNEDEEIVEQYSLGKLLSIFAKVCDSMAFAHSRGVIHRDLKPANIMVGEFGEVLVMDWGLGKVLDAESQSERVADSDESADEDETHEPVSSVRSPHKTDMDSRVDSVRTEDDASRTRAGAIMGTPTFMPPEQAQGLIEKLDATSDVYSLGAILYNLLFLVPPIRGESATDVLTRVIRGDVEYPEDLERTRDWALPHCPGDRVPNALSAVAMRALEWEQADRYQNVSELQREIEAWQSGFATQAEEAGRWRQISLFIARNRGLATAMLAIFIALSIGLVATFIQWDKAVAAKEKSDGLFADLQKEEERRKGEYEARVQVSREAAPEFVTKARDLLNLGKSDEGRTAITTALALHEELPSAWFEKGRLDLDSYEFDAAAAAFGRVIELAADDVELRQQAEGLSEIARKYAALKNESEDGLLPERLLTLAVDVERFGDATLAGRLFRRAGDERQGMKVRLLDAFARLEEANPELRFNRSTGSPMDATPYAYFHWHHVLREDGLKLGLPRMNSGGHLIDITPLRGLPVRHLTLNSTGIGNLDALREMPLNYLDVGNTGILSIDEISGLPIETLDISGTQITDLSVLATLPLKQLSMRELKVESLSPLEGLKLESLETHSASGFSDISPLRGMPLKFLGLKNTQVTDLSPLAGMPLETVSLPSGATDLSPLKDLPLKVVDIPHTEATSLKALAGKKLESLYVSTPLPMDWSGLADIEATRLSIYGNNFEDLSLISHMPLTELIVGSPKITDLSPLADLSLRKIQLRDMKITDLSPLKGMPLEEIVLTNCTISDLSPLADMPITFLHITDCPITSIEAVRKMPLHTLYLVDCTQLNDLTPIADIETIRHLAIPEHCTEIEFLRDIDTIQELNTKPFGKSPAQFWREYESRQHNR